MTETRSLAVGSKTRQSDGKVRKTCANASVPKTLLKSNRSLLPKATRRWHLRYALPHIAEHELKASHNFGLPTFGPTQIPTCVLCKWLIRQFPVTGPSLCTLTLPA